MFHYIGKKAGGNFYEEFQKMVSFLVRNLKEKDSFMAERFKRKKIMKVNQQLKVIWEIE